MYKLPEANLHSMPSVEVVEYLLRLQLGRSQTIIDWHQRTAQKYDTSRDLLQIKQEPYASPYVLNNILEHRRATSERVAAYLDRPAAASSVSTLASPSTKAMLRMPAPATPEKDKRGHNPASVNSSTHQQPRLGWFSPETTSHAKCHSYNDAGNKLLPSNPFAAGPDHAEPPQHRAADDNVSLSGDSNSGSYYAKRDVDSDKAPLIPREEGFWSRLNIKF